MLKKADESQAAALVLPVGKILAQPHLWLSSLSVQWPHLERVQAVMKRLAAGLGSPRYHSNSGNIAEPARFSRSLWGSGEQLFNACKSALKPRDEKCGRGRMAVIATTVLQAYLSAAAQRNHA